MPDLTENQVSVIQIAEIKRHIMEIYKKAKVGSHPCNDSYQQSYEPLKLFAEETLSFLKVWGKTKKKEDRQKAYNSLVVLAHAVYGWMPTILNINKKKAKRQKKNGDRKDIVEIMFDISEKPEDLIQNSDKNKDVIQDLVCFVNNSFVGLSKMLHFLFPDNYAIWDSNICSILEFKSPNSAKNFIAYEKAIKQASEELSCSSLRDIEKCLFYEGRK